MGTDVGTGEQDKVHERKGVGERVLVERMLHGQDDRHVNCRGFPRGREPSKRIPIHRANQIYGIGFECDGQEDGRRKGTQGRGGHSCSFQKIVKEAGARARKKVRRWKIAESSAVKDDDKSGNREPKERSGRRGQKADAAQPSAPREPSV